MWGHRYTQTLRRKPTKEGIRGDFCFLPHSFLHFPNFLYKYFTSSKTIRVTKKPYQKRLNTSWREPQQESTSAPTGHDSPLQGGRVPGPSRAGPAGEDSAGESSSPCAPSVKACCAAAGMVSPAKCSPGAIPPMCLFQKCGKGSTSANVQPHNNPQSEGKSNQ